MKEIYQKAYQILESGQDLVLVFLVDHSGSTPRETGSRMLVLRDRSIVGSIGGGKVEAAAIDKAMEVFENKTSCLEKFNLTTDEVAGLGMACGGAVTVFLQYLAATEENRRVHRSILDAYMQAEQKWLITTAASSGCVQEVTGAQDEHCLSHAVFLPRGDGFRLIEPITKISRAIIFGAGHVGCALAPVLERIDFGITVVDDRAEFANRARFPMADDILVCDVDSAFDKLKIDTNSYIIIVTRGHKHDQDVLEKALKTDAKYIGMIGSRKKVAAVLENLRNSGVSQQDLDRVFSPIGLSIGAHTPEEIAVSIAAEMICVRAGKHEK